MTSTLCHAVTSFHYKYSTVNTVVRAFLLLVITLVLDSNVALVSSYHVGTTLSKIIQRIPHDPSSRLVRSSSFSQSQIQSRWDRRICRRGNSNDDNYNHVDNEDDFYFLDELTDAIPTSVSSFSLDSSSTFSFSTTPSDATPADTDVPNSSTESSTSFSTTTTTTDTLIATPQVEGDSFLVTAPICRLVTRADAKLPTSKSKLPSTLFQTPRPTTLDKLDAYYHALGHYTTRSLQYVDKTSRREVDEGIPISATTITSTITTDADAQGRRIVVDRTEEQTLVSVVRNSLEDAGFELLSRRDLDLCESLNAGYLLRLSILPDVKDLDPGLEQEFYPERFVTPSNSGNGKGNTDTNSTTTPKQYDELLFGGRVLVYWRGYSEEVTKGRLFLPKIDYLQASLVQRSAAWVKGRLDAVESQVVQRLLVVVSGIQRMVRSMTFALIESVPLKMLTRGLQRVVIVEDDDMGMRDEEEQDDDSLVAGNKKNNIPNGRFKLARYGGSKTKFVGSPNPNDALNPFMICEIDYNEPELRPSLQSKFFQERLVGAERERRLYREMNHHTLTCEYDERISKAGRKLPTMQLLDRVSISNLVDLFSASGRDQLIRTLFASSELVEPTYEEVRSSRVVDIGGWMANQPKKICMTKSCPRRDDSISVSSHECLSLCTVSCPSVVQWTLSRIGGCHLATPY
jgi:hypothetical protein